MRDIGRKKVAKKHIVLHVLEPEPEGTIGGADMHVMELAKFQSLNTKFQSIVFINQNHAFADLLKKNGINYILLERKKGFLKHLFEFIKWLSKNNVNIIHGHGYDSNYIIFLVKLLSRKAKNIPVVMTCHGWIKNNITNIIKTYLDYIAISAADSLIYTSKNIVNNKLNKDKYFTYIPNSVFEKKIDGYVNIQNYFNIKNKIIIGYIGRLSSEKRIDILLHACNEIKKSYSNICFIIIGKGPEEKKLYSLVKKLNIIENVIFAGLILDSNIITNVYHQINFLIQTSDTETTSRVILEAMSAKKAVIATNVGGMEQLIQHKKTGFLVKKGDYLAVARYSIKLIKNPDLAKYLGQNAYKRYVKNFTMEKQVLSTEKVYRKSLLVYK